MAQYTNTAFIFFKVQDSPCFLVIFEVMKLEHFHTKIKEPGVLVTSAQHKSWCGAVLEHSKYSITAEWMNFL